MTTKDLIKEILHCDLGDRGYHGKGAPENKFQVIAKSPGMICGIDLIELIVRIVEQEFFLTPYTDSNLRRQVSPSLFCFDGDMVKPGKVIAELYGNSEVLLKSERTICNLVSRLSGIATETHKMVSGLSETKVHLLDTRKDIAIFRHLDQHAVITGGGKLHRSDLDDGIMIKDNDARVYGGIRQALNVRCETKRVLHKVEVEVADFMDLADALSDERVNTIMLDNMSLDDMTHAVSIIRKAQGSHEIEASGIGRLDIVDVAKTGVDFISTSSLITRGLGNPLDVSMKAR